jgi:hypothetical protein
MSYKKFKKTNISQLNESIDNPQIPGWVLHGFDLSDMDANSFRELLAKYKIPVLPCATESGAWLWKGDTVHLYTANCPISGVSCEIYTRGVNRVEKDYLSYVGIEAHPTVIKKFVSDFKKYASFIKDESVGQRDYI